MIIRRDKKVIILLYFRLNMKKTLFPIETKYFPGLQTDKDHGPQVLRRFESNRKVWAKIPDVVLIVPF